MATKSIEESKGIIISYFTLRKAIGWLGILLPFLLLLSNYFIYKLNILNNDFFVEEACSREYIPDGVFKTSISHYYYSPVGILFSGVMVSVALFLFSYKGHVMRPGEKGLSDNFLTHLAGVAALGIVIFPTGSSHCISDNIYTFQGTGNSGLIHFILAAVFFICLSLISIVNFRRTKDKKYFGKGYYHTLYLICGIGMLTCIALLFIYNQWLKGSYDWLDNLHPIFSLEAIALIFFGISWLTKGRVDFLFILRKLRLLKQSAPES